MPVALKVDVIGANELARDLGRCGTGTPAFRQAMLQALRVVDAAIERNLRGGHPLYRRSGALAQSIHENQEVIRGPQGYEGVIGPQNIIYARVHELGKTITPKRGKYLRFIWAPRGTSPGMLNKLIGTKKGKARGIGWVSVKSVRIPPRPYLAPAAKRSATRIAALLGKAYIASVEHGG